MTVLKVIANKSAAALAFAALVAIQTSVGLVYRFSQQTNGSYAFSQASALAISEVIKFFIAAVMFHHSMRDRSDYPSPGVGTRTSRLRNLYAELRAQLSNRLLALLAGLALSYAINNHVAFALYQLADPGTIQLVKSGSTFISAIFLCLALGRHVSKLQWLAILLQASGLISTQYREDSDATVQPLCTYSFLLLSTTITSVNSCWNDYLCKNYSASLPAQNMGLYASGAVINIVIFCFKSAFGDEPGFFAGYNNPLALVVILLNSCIGVAITFVYKYADAVIKSIAGSVTTALLVVLSAILFGAKITVLTGTGSLIIFISTYIYMVHAPIPAATQRRDGRQAQALVTASSDTDLKTKGPTATQLKPRRRIKLAVCFGVCLIVVLTTLAVPGERPPISWERKKPVDTSKLPVRPHSVAYCIVGRMRGFAYPETHRSFKENVVDVFSPKEDSSLVADTFFAVTMDDDSNNTVQQLAAAIDFVQPTEFLALSNVDPIPDNECKVAPNTYPPGVGSMAGRLHQQFRKVQQCYERLQAREFLQGWRYDWLVRVRPDILWSNNYPVTTYNASREHVSLSSYPTGWGTVSDHWAIVPHQLAGKYFNAADGYFNCTTFSEFDRKCPLGGHPRTADPADNFNPECYLAKWLHDQHVDLLELHTMFSVVRPSGEHFKPEAVLWGKPPGHAV